ncbi:MAG: alpha-L-fucosidase [Phycisphaerae bacterium]
MTIPHAASSCLSLARSAMLARALAVVASTLATLAFAQDDSALPKPTPAQLGWHRNEIGMFIHIAPQTWQGRETDDGSTPLSSINPDKLDTDQWVAVAESMGAKYIVFVAKHEGGFCWWQTATTDWSVKSIPWRAGKGDVLRDLAESCRRKGMKLGVYISPQDRHHGAGVGGRAKDPAKQADYEKLFRAQLTEVLSNYGEMMEVWFDGSLVFDVGDIVSKHAPNAVVFQGPQASIRWVGNEIGVAPYPAWNAVKHGVRPWGEYTAADGDPSGDRWLPNECDARLRDTWFWNPRNEATIKSVKDLLRMHDQSVGRGAVLLLNVTPDTTGAMPEADVRRAAEFGKALEAEWGIPVSETQGEGAEFVIQPSASLSIDRVVVQERIEEGERVRAYVVEALVDDQWRTVATGSAVGHKRIERFAPVQAASMRLRITDSRGTPLISRFAIFRTR